MLSVCCGIYKTQLHGFGLSYWQKLIKWSLSNWTSSLCAFDSVSHCVSPPKPIHYTCCMDSPVVHNMLSWVCWVGCAFWSWTEPLSHPALPPSGWCAHCSPSSFLPERQVYVVLFETKAPVYPFGTLLKCLSIEYLRMSFFQYESFMTPLLKPLPLTNMGSTSITHF